MYLSISPSTYLSIYLSVCLSIYLSICKLENEASLRDFLNFWTWQHQKRSKFCETASIFELDSIKNEAILQESSIFEVDNIKNKAILRDILQT